MKRILYYDCFAGISGDMNLGALVDLGVPAEHLEKQLGLLDIEGFRLEVEPAMRRGISGTKVTVVVDHPENEKHRHLHHIEELIRRSDLPEAVKGKAIHIFMKVAEAESRVHNIDIQKVHFHEVGALDSIADIVGAAICQEYLEVDEIHASSIQLGGGMVKCAHGLMPVPAPATAEIVAGLPVKTGLVDYEATTPTGAAILAATVDSYPEHMEMNITKTGYGIGQRDGEIPNVLRVFLAERESGEIRDVITEEAIMLECNLDDMPPERYTHIMDLLYAAGAADVFIIPMVMKKSRPGHLLSVLCNRDSAEDMKEILFRESSSIGLREQGLRKSMLRREMVKVKTIYGEVEVKRSYWKGRVVNEKPEFEQCRKMALEHGISLEEVQKEVIRNL